VTRPARSHSDQGSTNGTWIGEQRIQGMVPLHPGVAVVVGSYMLMLETGTGVAKPLTAVGVARPGGLGSGLGARPIGVGTAGPLIRKSDNEHRDRQFHDRVSRYAAEWDKVGRPGRLLLRGRNLSHALELLESGGDPDLRFGELEESFIRASKEGRERNNVRRIGIGAGSVLLLIGPSRCSRPLTGDDESRGRGRCERGSSETASTSAKMPYEGEDRRSKAVTTTPRAEKAIIEHSGDPGRDCRKIALRYDVSIQSVVRWNASTKAPARARQAQDQRPRVPSRSSGSPTRPDKRSRGRKQSLRRAGLKRKPNPHPPTTSSNGLELTIWVDPKPLKKKPTSKSSVHRARTRSRSVRRRTARSRTASFPPNDKLYKRRNPQIMRGAPRTWPRTCNERSRRFRYTYDFEGGRRRRREPPAGPVSLHKSHQAVRTSTSGCRA
jgi:hypothetical protein